MADEIEDTIETNATGPKRVRGDSGEIEQHSLKDQIEVDRYLASKKAIKNGKGFKLSRLISPDAI